MIHIKKMGAEIILKTKEKIEQIFNEKLMQEKERKKKNKNNSDDALFNYLTMLPVLYYY